MPLIHASQASLTFFIAEMGLLGLVVGSFLNVVAYRLPRMMEAAERRYCRALLQPDAPAQDEAPLGLIWPRSRCPHCGHAIRAFENVPVLSWLLLRGRCSACHARISARYPSIELLSALLTAAVAWRFGAAPQALFAALLTWALIALAAIDLECQLLPDDITLPMLWAGLIANLFGMFTNLHWSVLGAAIGYLLLWAVYRLYKAATGKEGMGYGDFKLLAMLGAWLGWGMLPLIILASSACGAVVGAGLIVFGGASRAKPIPFGPYLAAAGWIALMWGPRITRAYLDWAAAT